MAQSSRSAVDRNILWLTSPSVVSALGEAMHDTVKDLLSQTTLLTLPSPYHVDDSATTGSRISARCIHGVISTGGMDDPLGYRSLVLDPVIYYGVRDGIIPNTYASLSVGPLGEKPWLHMFRLVDPVAGMDQRLISNGVSSHYGESGVLYTSDEPSFNKLVNTYNTIAAYLEDALNVNAARKALDKHCAPRFEDDTNRGDQPDTARVRHCMAYGNLNKLMFGFFNWHSSGAIDSSVTLKQARGDVKLE